MLARYLRVRGVPGHLVAHPHADARRYLGKAPNNPYWDEGPPGEDGRPMWPAAKPVEEDVRDDAEGYVRKMIRKGGLELVATCTASSLSAAKPLLDAEAKKRNAPHNSAPAGRTER